MPVIVKRPTNRQHASIIQSNLRKKNLELNHAIQYCKENNVRGYAAIAAGICPSIKDPRTINKHLSNDGTVDYNSYFFFNF